jgi:hypothetical protein
MTEQARRVENKAIPEWAQGLYYNSGLMSEVLVYYDDEAIYIRAQGEGERHSALHLRDDRRPEDSGGRTVRRLAGVESPTSQDAPFTRLGE